MNLISCLFQIVALIVAVSAEPGYYGQYSWPSTYGHGFASTCYGCRGKRSAEPGYYGYGGYAGHYGGGSSYVGRTIWGLGKRSADAEPEAEAEADAEPGYYGHGYGYGGYGGYGYGRGYGYGH